MMSIDVPEFVWRGAEPHAHQHLVLPVIRRFLPASGQLLDLGCGNGWLSEQYRLAGFRVTARDMSKSGVEAGSKAFPLVRFELGNVSDPLGGPYDCIVSSEVIEHLYDPPAMLNAAYVALRPGGLLIVTTPYHGYLKNLALSLFNKWDHHFSVLSTGWHIKFYSRATLSTALTTAGFRDLRFAGAGRAPLLWKSMVMAGVKPV